MSPKDEGHPPGAPAQNQLASTQDTPPARRQAVTSGLQTASGGLVRLLEGWREQLSPREYTVLIDLVARWLEVERQRDERLRRRWAA